MIVFVDERFYYYVDEKGKLQAREREPGDDFLKGKRAVYVGNQAVLGIEYTGRGIESLISDEGFSSPAWYEEVVERTKNKIRSNIYVASVEDISPLIVQKPLSLVSVYFVLKKIAENRGWKRFVVGKSLVDRAYVVPFSDGFVEEGARGRRRGGTLDKSPREVEEAIRNSGYSDYLILGLNISYEELSRELAELHHLTAREYTILSPALREVFYETSKEKELFSALKISGVAVGLVSLLYIGGAVGDFYVKRELASVSREASVLSRKIQEMKRKRIYSFAERNTRYPERVKLAFPEEFLFRLDQKEQIYRFPLDLLTEDNLSRLVSEAMQKRCTVRKISSFLLIACRNVEERK